jgi:hypothetical protein
VLWLLADDVNSTVPPAMRPNCHRKPIRRQYTRSYHVFSLYCAAPNTVLKWPAFLSAGLPLASPHDKPNDRFPTHVRVAQTLVGCRSLRF